MMYFFAGEKGISVSGGTDGSPSVAVNIKPKKTDTSDSLTHSAIADGNFIIHSENSESPNDLSHDTANANEKLKKYDRDEMLNDLVKQDKYMKGASFLASKALNSFKSKDEDLEIHEGDTKEQKKYKETRKNEIDAHTEKVNAMNTYNDSINNMPFYKTVDTLDGLTKSIDQESFTPFLKDIIKYAPEKDSAFLNRFSLYETPDLIVRGDEKGMLDFAGKISLNELQKTNFYKKMIAWGIKIGENCKHFFQHPVSDSKKFLENQRALILEQKRKGQFIPVRINTH